MHFSSRVACEKTGDVEQDRRKRTTSTGQTWFELAQLVQPCQASDENSLFLQQIAVIYKI